MQDFRLVLPAAILWLLAILGPLDYPVVIFVGLVLALSGVLRSWTAVTLAGVCLICGSITGWVHHGVEQTDAVNRAPEGEVLLVGEVASHMKAGAFTMQLDTIQWNGPDGSELARSSAGKVRVRWDGQLLYKGQKVVVAGKLSRAPEIGFVTASCVQADPPKRLNLLIANAVEDRPWHAQLIPGVVVGDDSRLQPEAVENMRVMGLSHLTAVSGAHMSIAIGAVLAIVGRKRPKVAALASLMAITGIVRIVGNQPSVLRAGYMGIGLCGGLALRRTTSAIPLLSLTVIGVALTDVRLAQSLGFQLSTVATFAIVVFSYPFQRALAKTLPRSVTDVLAISLIASVATAPLLLGIQERSSVWSPLANALVAPAFAPLTILGMAGSLMLLVWPPLGHLMLRMCEPFTWWLGNVAGFMVKVPGIFAPLTTLAITVAVVALIIVAVRLELVVPLFVAFAGIACAMAAMPVVASAQAGILPNWQVVQCDVGQGSAMLVRNKQVTAMVDVGEAGSGADRCLRAAGVKKLDLLVLSHFDADHVRGTEDVLGAVEVGEVWYSQNPHPVATSQWVARLLDARGIPHRAASRGDAFPATDASAAFPAHGEEDGARPSGDPLVTIVGPRSAYGTDSDTNADSLVVRAQTEDHSVLILADSPGVRQSALVGLAGEVDVVVAGHHGARDQSESLAKSLKPEVALFSVGEGNTYGHPSQEALTTWAAPVQQRTDLCGDISLDGGSVLSKCGKVKK